MASERKTYVLDTNVLMSDPDCLFQFDEHTIAIPTAVVEELDRHKNDPGDAGYNVRKISRLLDSLGSSFTIPDTEKKILFPAECSFDGFPESWDRQKNDNRILAATKAIPDAILVSKDVNMRVKARILGIPVQNYRHETVEEDYLTYCGRTEARISAMDLEELQKENPIDIDRVRIPCRYLENEFLVLSAGEETSQVLGRFCQSEVRPLSYRKVSPFGVRPRNVGQIFAMEALLSPPEELPLVILTGAAGTAKTFLTLACGLYQIMDVNRYRKMVITRANVDFDAIGTLPGDETDKIGPLMRGCMDNLEQILEKNRHASGSGIQEEIRSILDCGILSIEAMAFLRGRSLTNQILYVDEAQNTTPSQIIGVLSRAGVGTKVVLSGDFNQIDNPKLDRHRNGLAHAIKMMAGDPCCCIVGFTDEEAARSELAAAVVKKISQE